MKKWTVMLIPHDRSSTRTLTLSSVHFSLVVGMLVALTFTTTFLFQRQRAIAAKNDRLYQINRALELSKSTQPQQEAPAAEGLSEEEMREMEAQLRAEYESSIGKIRSELDELYEMEAKARDITGMEPRDAQPDVAPEEAVGDGKGGGGGDFGTFVYSGIDERFRPAHIIYGMARPPADLILQEIQLRKRSLNDLVTGMEKQLDKVERVPSLWPLVAKAGKITSHFGYRRDPFHRRVRHHDGTDISAPVGTKVRATAKGTVVFSGFDGNYGNLVKIDHGNGLQTWYAHMSKRTVNVGDQVLRNDVIGHVGSTGRSTGPHLHYEVHVSGKPVNAAKYLSE